MGEGDNPYAAPRARLTDGTSKDLVSAYLAEKLRNVGFDSVGVSSGKSGGSEVLKISFSYSDYDKGLMRALGNITNKHSDLFYLIASMMGKVRGRVGEALPDTNVHKVEIMKLWPDEKIIEVLRKREPEVLQEAERSMGHSRR